MVTSAAVMKAAMDKAAKTDPSVAAHMPNFEPTTSLRTETHFDIVVNQKLYSELS